ncbi:hypothetical protein SPF06_04950 [Sinomonas sp. JGH33]|uniref:Uncharacterized protein n=1 Tax=Sinomonas terricola TaxID=3110330 RepID=A0ABU5T330_9MICC|nr:hypothetical protein [Sinomonas sp. JGH33]MEA5454066.1 hypothetical protein [Sinomonas sp. JGH33]
MNWVDIVQGIGSLATAIALFYVARSTAHAKKAAEAADPICDVGVVRPRGVTQNGTNIDAISLTLKVLPPGIYFLDPKDKGDDMLTGVSPGGLRPIFRNIDYCAELTFRDGSSALWCRSRIGQLAAVDGGGAVA